MFEHSLIDLETQQQPRRRRWLSLPIAIALHVVGLTAFAFASYWTIGSVAEPDTVVPFVQFIEPSQELLDGDSGRPRTPEPERVQTATNPAPPSQTVQPTDETIPDIAPPTLPPTNVDDLFTDGVADDFTGDRNLSTGSETDRGSGGGGKKSSGGTVNGKENDAEIRVEDDQPIRFTVGMTRPELHQ